MGLEKFRKMKDKDTGNTNIGIEIFENTGKLYYDRYYKYYSGYIIGGKDGDNKYRRQDRDNGDRLNK